MVKTKFIAKLLKESSKPQTGDSVKEWDKKLTAMKSGKRISKNGKKYWETRANRSDIDPESGL